MDKLLPEFMRINAIENNIMKECKQFPILTILSTYQDLKVLNFLYKLLESLSFFSCY